MTSEDQKAARLAAALRANLAKRKAQKRARAESPSAGEAMDDSVEQSPADAQDAAAPLPPGTRGDSGST